MRGVWGERCEGGSHSAVIVEDQPGAGEQHHLPLGHHVQGPPTEPLEVVVDEPQLTVDTKQGAYHLMGGGGGRGGGGGGREEGGGRREEGRRGGGTSEEGRGEEGGREGEGGRESGGGSGWLICKAL